MYQTISSPPNYSGFFPQPTLPTKNSRRKRSWLSSMKHSYSSTQESGTCKEEKTGYPSSLSIESLDTMSCSLHSSIECSIDKSEALSNTNTYTESFRIMEFLGRFFPCSLGVNCSSMLSAGTLSRKEWESICFARFLGTIAYMILIASSMGVIHMSGIVLKIAL